MMRIKAVLGDDIRRIAIERHIPLENFEHKLSAVFEVPSLTITYVDEDGDVITVSRDEDLREAIENVALHSEMNPKPLRFLLTEGEPRPTSAASTRSLHQQIVVNHCCAAAKLAGLKRKKQAEKEEALLTWKSRCQNPAALPTQPAAPIDFGSEFTAAVQPLDAVSDTFHTLFTSIAGGLHEVGNTLSQIPHELAKHHRRHRAARRESPNLVSRVVNGSHAKAKPRRWPRSKRSSRSSRGGRETQPAAHDPNDQEASTREARSPMEEMPQAAADETVAVADQHTSAKDLEKQRLREALVQAGFMLEDWVVVAEDDAEEDQPRRYSREDAAEVDAAAAGRLAGISLLTESMKGYIVEHGPESASLREWVVENEPSVQNGTRPLELFMTEGTNAGYHEAWQEAMAQAQADQALLPEASAMKDDLDEQQQELLSMGFPRDEVDAALAATRSIEHAADLLLAKPK